jgi:hypothetical protein
MIKSTFLLLAGFLTICQVIFAQDRYPLEDEDLEVVKVLEEAGVDLEYPKILTYINPWKELLWVKAPLPFFERLLALGKEAEPELGNGIYESPLVMAIQHNNYEVADFLIKNGANVHRVHSGRALSATSPALLRCAVWGFPYARIADKSQCGL